MTWCDYWDNDLLATGAVLKERVLRRRVMLTRHARLGLAILWCHEALYYLRRLPQLLIKLWPIRPSKANIENKTTTQKAASISHYIHLALGIDLAVEIPLFVAFHPVTLIFGTDFRAHFPGMFQFLLQVLVLVLIEHSFHYWTLWFAGFLSSAATSKDFSVENPDDLAHPFGLAMEFMRPRGTLLIAIAGLGIPSKLHSITGDFHVATVIAWVALRQFQADHSQFEFTVPRKSVSRI